ncbi:MAG: hypothetical protein HN413_12980 [Chloroflexi bacterium]|jgi:hypothetical protein|nr:hypothetical protein [Chloroflexota bacterium]
MYLPEILPNVRVLVAVKTYPVPSAKYDELVCNAGFLENGNWIRIYPIQFRALPYAQQYKKYDWIQLGLERNRSDFRQESYRPIKGVDEPIQTLGNISTGKNRDWAERKRFALNEVFVSMNELINLAKTSGVWKSLATVKPKEIVDFVIEPDDREWKASMRNSLRQLKLFEQTTVQREAQIVRKLPYRYYYRFLTEGDDTPRKMMIEDWEIGALYWNCLAQTEGDEVVANELVQKKYCDEFLNKDLYLFVGTTKANHMRGPNPFVIIGVFYPPKSLQMPLL